MKYLHAHTVSSHDKRYAYATGRIRALEMRLLGRQRLERMAEAKDMDEAVRLLSDTDYALHLEELEEHGYETFLKNEEARLLDLVDSLSLDQEVSDILRLRLDFHNLKVALREHVSGKDLSHLYLTSGRMDHELTKTALKADSPELTPEPLRAGALAGLAAYEGTRDPAMIDVAVDRVMFGLFLKRARSYGAIYVESIVKTWIDLANIRTYLRGRFIKLESREVAPMLYSGGSVKLTDLLETYPLPLDEALQRFEFSPYRSVIEAGSGALERDESFAGLERAIDNHLISFLRLSRYFTFGLEVVLAYALLRQNEIKALRLVLAAKDRGLPLEFIKERIPDAE